jgi:hypothetical protein
MAKERKTRNEQRHGRKSLISDTQWLYIYNYSLKFFQIFNSLHQTGGNSLESFGRVSE